MTRFWSGDTEKDLARVGWYRGNSAIGEDYGVGTHAVGKAANAFGLFDMHGNVCQWCADWYDDGFYARSSKMNPFAEQESVWQSRVIRGGDAYSRAENCRSASRYHWAPDCSHNDIGFRVVAVGL
jgi:formylglycine-generating enzyme required for sulfatase activity